MHHLCIHLFTAADKPFFLYYAYHHTHLPQYAGKMYTNSTIRGKFGDALVSPVIMYYVYHNGYRSCSNWSASLIIAPLRANHIFCVRKDAPVWCLIYFWGCLAIRTASSHITASVPEYLLPRLTFLPSLKSSPQQKWKNKGRKNLNRCYSRRMTFSGKFCSNSKRPSNEGAPSLLLQFSTF